MLGTKIMNAIELRVTGEQFYIESIHLLKLLLIATSVFNALKSPIRVTIEKWFFYEKWEKSVKAAYTRQAVKTMLPLKASSVRLFEALKMSPGCYLI